MRSLPADDGMPCSHSLMLPHSYLFARRLKCVPRAECADKEIHFHVRAALALSRVCLPSGLTVTCHDAGDNCNFQRQHVAHDLL